MDYVSFDMIQSEAEPQENISVLESIMILRYDDMEYEYDVSGQYMKEIFFFPCSHHGIWLEGTRYMTMSPRSRIHSRHWSTTISNGSTSHMDIWVVVTSLGLVYGCLAHLNQPSSDIFAYGYHICLYINHILYPSIFPH